MNKRFNLAVIGLRQRRTDRNSNRSDDSKESPKPQDGVQITLS